MSERLRLERDLYLRILELGSAEDVRPFLEEALGLVVELTGAQRGYIELDGGAFWMARGFGAEELARVRREISTGIVAEALATGRTLSTASAVEDPRFSGNESVQARGIRAVLCAPIGSPPLGVLYLQERSAAGPFPEEDRARAEVFARHIAPFADRLLAKEASASGSSVDQTAELRVRVVAPGIVGTGAAIAGVLRQVLVAAPVPVAVLITGESGTGKTVVARAIHDSSPRASRPFVEINCAAIPEGLFESELFGAEEGAHSTARRRIEGKVDAARGGTLFLDEVGELPQPVQGKLLTFLQSKRYYRLGGTEAISADVRIVAATNRDLGELVRERRFREDLYYRLNVLEIRVPPLAERREDIGEIASSIVAALGAAHGRPLGLSRSAKVALSRAEWPGNVRQLENALARGWAVALAEGAPSVEARHIFGAASGASASAAGAAPATFQAATFAFQGRLIAETLEAAGWNVSEAARRLDVSRSHLNDLIRAHGLTRR